MKCFTKPCQEEGTVVDWESPPIFVNPENPNGPTVRPVLCEAHHREQQQRRAENEASYWRMVRGR